ncbi:hypothetical protein CLF_107118 [Clonorchis sinensis]|uniref:Nucleolar protein 4 helical domain-containing protein n=1 Tax=Clonorchis sinensis TaxID=79923 RepID=G7YG64_CLOSI|nr:hypothetical protein CLF_107118 [Clonorchis sinensis]
MESEIETRELVIVQPESPLEFEKLPCDIERKSPSNFGTTCLGIKTIQQNTHSQNDPSSGIPKFQDGKVSEHFGEQMERKHFSEREITYNLVLRKLVDSFMDRSVTYSHQPKSLLHTLCSSLARNFPELGDAYHRERICAYLKACRRNAKKKHGEPYVRMSARYLSAGTAARLAEEIYLKEKDYLLNGQRSLEDSVSYQFHTPPNSNERREIDTSKLSDEATSITGGTPVTVQSPNIPNMCIQSPLDSTVAPGVSLRMKIGIVNEAVRPVQEPSFCKYCIDITWGRPLSTTYSDVCTDFRLTVEKTETTSLLVSESLHVVTCRPLKCVRLQAIGQSISHRVDPTTAFRISLQNVNWKFLAFGEAMLLTQYVPALCGRKSLTQAIGLPWIQELNRTGCVSLVRCYSSLFATQNRRFLVLRLKSKNTEVAFRNNGRAGSQRHAQRSTDAAVIKATLPSEACSIICNIKVGLRMSLFRELLPVWVQTEDEINGLEDCAYLMIPKREKTVVDYPGGFRNLICHLFRQENELRYRRYRID